MRPALIDVPPLPGHIVHAVIRPRVGTPFRRPGLIMQRRLDDTFGILTFTIAPTHGNGTPRIGVDWQTHGLNQPCYLFSERLAIVPPRDLRGVISVATPELIDIATRFLNWRPDQQIGLRQSRDLAARMLTSGVR